MNTVRNEAYGAYQDLPLLSYNCIAFLMENNELLWKLLYYPESDAWNKANLTTDQKASIIYAGQDDSSSYRVFMDLGQNDSFTSEACVLRISPFIVIPDNPTVGSVTMAFEVYTHYKINTLSNYTNRTVLAIQQVLQTLNGKNIAGIGKLFFDRMGAQEDRIIGSGQTPYKGMFLTMTNKVA